MAVEPLQHGLVPPLSFCNHQPTLESTKRHTNGYFGFFLCEHAEVYRLQQLDNDCTYQDRVH
jgi:hypothetical protein